MKRRFLFLLLSCITFSACFDIHENVEGYYENGTFYFWHGGSGQGKLLDGKKVGEWRFKDYQRLDAGGGAFLNQKMQGKWEFMHSNGLKKSLGDFDGDIQVGNWTYWRNDGSKESRGNFEEGKKEGSWVFWHVNGAEMSRGNYSSGNRTGLWKFSYPDGINQEDRLYRNGLGYLLRAWFPDGREMVVDGQGPYEFWENGRLKEKGIYLDSLAAGDWLIYDKNGVLTERITYIKGIRQ